MKSSGKLKPFFERWFRPRWLAFIIVSAILLCYSSVIVAQIKKDVDNNNRHFAEYYNASLESSLNAFQEFSNTLIHSKAAEQLHSFTKETIQRSEGLRLAYSLTYNIRSYCLSNDVWDDIYIYYPANDMIVGFNGAFSSYNYFKTEHVTMDPLEEDYRKWMNTLFSKRKNGYFTLHDGGGENNIYFYHDISYYGNESNNRILVAKISRNLLNSGFHDLLRSERYQYVALIDKEGRIYGEAGDNAEFVNDQARFNFWKSNEKHVIYFAGSKTWPLTFVSVQDYGTAYQTVRTISMFIILGIILAMLGSVVILAYDESKRKKAMDQIVRRFDTQLTADGKNTLDFIGEEIDKLIQSNRQALDAADRQQKTISSFFLQEILRQGYSTGKDIELIGSLYDINMENSLFSFIVAKNKQNGRMDKQERESLMQLISKTENDSFSVYWTQFDGLEVFLCNYDDLTVSPQGPVIEFAKNLRSVQEDRYEIHLSPIMKSVDEIGTVWQKMYGEIETRNLQSSNKIISTDEDVTLIRAFGDAIDNEDVSAAVHIVSEVSRHMTAQHNPCLIRCRKYCLVSKLYERYNSESTLKLINRFVDEIEAEDWEQKLTQLINALNQEINQSVDLRQVADVAKEIMLREYSNPQLSLHMIAERLGISQSYLSRLFKQKNNMGALQYLNYIRIEQAKKLIMEGNDNLKVIAMTVGYLSDVNLIRVFKKYENMTPGSFRSQNEMSETNENGVLSE